MKLIDAIKKLKSLGMIVLTTADVAACLGISRPYASKVMDRLAGSGFAFQLTRGKWTVEDKLDRLLIPELLMSPSLSYISLQTALFHHGLISQIPETVYAVTTGKTNRLNTPSGTFSIHHLEPEFFFGFEPMGQAEIKMATPEKALLDIFYLGPTRSRIFTTLPEVEISRKFNVRKAREMILRIPSESRKTYVKERFEQFIRKNK